MATYKLVDEEKLDAAMTATADAIREKTGSTDPIAWDAEKGMSEAVDPVFEAGKKSEYDAFWDTYQVNGDRVDYSKAFAGVGWIPDLFKPKYNIVGTRFDYCFNYNRFMKCDLVEILKECNISIDTSNATLFGSMFEYSTFTRIGAFDLTKGTSFYNFIAYSDIETIDSLIIGNGNQNLNGLLKNGSKLVNVLIDGTIGSDFECKESSLLSKESIFSIINALSTITTNLTITLSQTAVNNAFETSPGAADGSTSEEWAALIATKPNWTIALADA